MVLICVLGIYQKFDWLHFEIDWLLIQICFDWLLCILTSDLPVSGASFEAEIQRIRTT